MLLSLSGSCISTVMEVGSRPLAERDSWPSDALGGPSAGMGCATRMWGDAAYGHEYGYRGHIYI